MSRPGIAFPLNGLYCKTGTGEWLNGCSRSNNTNTNQAQHMDEKITRSFTLSNKDRRVEIACGNIWGHDDSNEIISIYVGTDALNAGITKYLKECSRDQQEAFMQTLTDHIRKIDNADA